ncbi:MAG: SMR family transporter, partial [Gammaproteobacteria bacterium]
MFLPYTFLFLAIILEVVGTLFLRDTEGFTRMVPNVIVIVSYA